LVNETKEKKEVKGRNYTENRKLSNKRFRREFRRKIHKVRGEGFWKGKGPRANKGYGVLGGKLNEPTARRRCRGKDLRGKDSAPEGGKN